MDPISNVDRLVILLRQRLQERAKATTAKSVRRTDTPEPTLTGLENVQAMAAAEGLGDDQLGRALIQSILSEHFGPELLNEAKFQQVVDRVAEALESDPSGSALLTQIVSELRSAAS